MTAQIRTWPRLTKGIQQLFVQTEYENKKMLSRHTYGTLLTALICFGFFVLDTFVAFPSIMTWSLRIAAFVSFAVLFIRISQQLLLARPAYRNEMLDITPPPTTMVGRNDDVANLWQLVASLPVPVMISQEAQILALNEACLHLTGWSTIEDAVGQTVVDWLPTGKQRNTLAQHLTATEQGTESSPVELSCQDLNAQPIEVELQSMLIDFKGAPAILTLFLTRRATSAVEQWANEEPEITGQENNPLASALCSPDEHAFLVNQLAMAKSYPKCSPSISTQLGLNFLHLDSSQRPLQPSQDHFRLLVEQSPVITYRCTWDDGPKLFYITANVKHILGYTDQEMMADPTFGAAQCHPDDAAPLWEIIRFSRETGAGQMEHRMRHKDGDYRWLLSQWRFLPNSDEYVGHILDITERKAIEGELAHSRVERRKLATRLNTVHEEERARMAREVHDVLGQNLTVLKFGLERMATELATAESSLTVTINKLIGAVDQTVEHVQHLSAQLRPGVLDELGLTSALEWLVCEFTWQTEFTVELDLPDDLPPIDDNLAIVLYRIVQEALTNIVRHAKASQVKIALEVTVEKAILTIQDNGCGFDPDQKRVKKSLGLIGMHERIAPWDGDVWIESKIGEGTTIQVEAMLSPI